MSFFDVPSMLIAQAAPEGNALMGMLPIILMFVILYFLMIRPQMKRQKQHRNLLTALSKGDEVVISGGLLGKIAKVTDTYLTVEIAEVSDKQPIEVMIQKAAVSAVLPKGTIKAL